MFNSKKKQLQKRAQYIQYSLDWSFLWSVSRLLLTTGLIFYFYRNHKKALTEKYYSNQVNSKLLLGKEESQKQYLDGLSRIKDQKKAMKALVDAEKAQAKKALVEAEKAEEQAKKALVEAEKALVEAEKAQAEVKKGESDPNEAKKVEAKKALDKVKKVLEEKNVAMAMKVVEKASNDLEEAKKALDKAVEEEEDALNDYELTFWDFFMGTQTEANLNKAVKAREAAEDEVEKKLKALGVAVEALEKVLSEEKTTIKLTGEIHLN